MDVHLSFFFSLKFHGFTSRKCLMDIYVEENYKRYNMVRV